MAKDFGIAVIGCGQRGQYVVENLLRDSQRHVHVKAVFDPDAEACRTALRRWLEPEARICRDLQEAIGTVGVDWVMVFSPNVFHKDGVLAGFAAGKHVFSEKPLATSIEDCVAINQAHARSGRQFATGFVLRYAPIYRKVKQLLDEGTFGRILAVDANEHIVPSHGGYIMCNWRRHSAMAGPHILEKCCHDLDLLIWYLQGLPVRVSAFGGREFFVKENESLMKEYGKKLFLCWQVPYDLDTPFSGDTDLMDVTTSIAEFDNGARVTFSATMSNALPERRIRLCCTRGVIVAELYTMTLRYRRLGEEQESVISYSGDGHAGGDSYIMKELYDCMCSGEPPKCSGAEGLRSAVYALAIDEAARTGQTVSLEKTWKRLAGSLE
ncbi:MAG: Gfo/Idh/MocA family oxidoreductase [Victivallales bacterium]|nr:Gfo/Idh/MocA family oxidoreductase [Victivallales bacterium]